MFKEDGISLVCMLEGRADDGQLKHNSHESSRIRWFSAGQNILVVGGASSNLARILGPFCSIG